MSTSDRPFRWAILGTGPVARRFALGLRILDHIEIATVASRDPSKATAFAAALGGRAVADYQAAVSEEVDAVYIATPPALHEEHARLAFAASRPVLIEKPLAMDAAAGRRIATAAAEAGVFAMEAMWTRFLPLLGAVRQKLGTGALGDLCGFEGAFLGATRPDLAMSLFDPSRGGGALLNRGVYPLSLARFLMGPIVDVRAVALIGQTGVDEETSLALRHASGALSTVRASLRTAGEPPLAIYGTQGVIRLDGPVWCPTGATLIPVRAGTGMAAPARFEILRETPFYQALSRRASTLKRRFRSGGQSIRAGLRGSGYHYEAAHLRDCLSLGAQTSDIMPISESVDILEVIDAARAQM